MAIDLIIDTDRMRELADKLKQGRALIEEAIGDLRKALRDPWDIPERKTINEVLDVSMKWLGKINDALEQIERCLLHHSKWFDHLLDVHAANERELAEDIKASDGGRLSTHVPSGPGQEDVGITSGNDPNADYYQNVIDNSRGWDASGGWDTVGATFPNERPDFNSVYYTGENPTGRQRAYGKEGRHGPDSIDCCFYARARAMEVNGWTKTYGTYTKDESIEAIKAGNRVVRFDTGRGDEMHFVFVEGYDPNTDTVYFSDANMGGSPATDGQLKSRSLDDFLNYFPKGRYRYTEIP